MCRVFGKTVHVRQTIRTSRIVLGLAETTAATGCAARRETTNRCRLHGVERYWSISQILLNSRVVPQYRRCSSPVRLPEQVRHWSISETVISRYGKVEGGLVIGVFDRIEGKA